MKGYKRTDRLAELIREEIADILISGSVKDLDIGFVTITRVKVSADLSFADVYFSVLDGSWDYTKQQLEMHRVEIQSYIGRDLRLKRLPKLRFFEDRSLEHVERIETLLKRIKDEEECS
ncbi:30S ribosome-binding factor RbfA [Thermosulfidibacter takaii]|nr:30S ribosome-binding factor RbfA [Thermosulfidibacter takaii]